MSRIYDHDDGYRTSDSSVGPDHTDRRFYTLRRWPWLRWFHVVFFTWSALWVPINLIQGDYAWAAFHVMTCVVWVSFAMSDYRAYWNERMILLQSQHISLLEETNDALRATNDSNREQLEVCHRELRVLWEQVIGNG